MAQVLIVDDHPFLLEGVAAVLAEAGHTVVGTASNGPAALETIARLDPEVVVMDVTMPQMDGIAVLAQLRSDGDQRPVILLTAQLSDSQIAEALAADVSGIITKLGGSGDLLVGIDVVLKGGRYLPGELLSRALDVARQSTVPSPLAKLSAREQEIARAAGLGMRNRTIAEKLNATEGAIKVTLHRIYGKLGVQNRTELARLIQQLPE